MSGRELDLLLGRRCSVRLLQSSLVFKLILDLLLLHLLDSILTPPHLIHYAVDLLLICLRLPWSSSTCVLIVTLRL